MDPTTLLAAVVEQQSWWQLLLEWGMRLVVLVATPVLTTLAVGLLRRQKVAIDEKRLAAIIDQAVGAAEQAAARALKSGAQPMGSAAKLRYALELSDKLVLEAKLAQLAEKEATERIEAALGLKRLAGPAAASP